MVEQVEIDARYYLDEVGARQAVVGQWPSWWGEEVGEDARYYGNEVGAKLPVPGRRGRRRGRGSGGRGKRWRKKKRRKISVPSHWNKTINSQQIERTNATLFFFFFSSFTLCAYVNPGNAFHWKMVQANERAELVDDSWRGSDFLRVIG